MGGIRRAARLVAALVITAAPVAFSQAPSGAATLPAPPVIKVVMGTAPSDMTANPVGTRRAGRVTFEVTTTTTDDGRDFSLVKLGRGVTPAEVITLVQRGLESDQPDPAALRRFNRAVTLLGGVTANPGSVASETLTLHAGVYYLLDTSGSVADAFAGGKRLVVRGPVQPTSFPRTSATVDMASPHVFRTIGHLPASGTIVVRNSDDEPHFMSMRPVPPGTTDAQIQAIFDRAAAGDEHAFDDLPSVEGPWVGTGVLSPGYQQLLTYDAPPGLYVLECFWPDAETGMPHAFMGMHAVVSIG